MPATTKQQPKPEAAREYRVIPVLNGQELPSGCIYSGPKANAEACAARLNARGHIYDEMRVLPCIE